MIDLSNILDDLKQGIPMTRNVHERKGFSDEYYHETWQDFKTFKEKLLWDFYVDSWRDFEDTKPSKSLIAFNKKSRMMMIQQMVDCKLIMYNKVLLRRKIDDCKP